MRFTNEEVLIALDEVHNLNAENKEAILQFLSGLADATEDEGFLRMVSVIENAK